jgi:hypothetical protein
MYGSRFYGLTLEKSMTKQKAKIKEQEGILKKGDATDEEKTNALRN